MTGLRSILLAAAAAGTAACATLGLGDILQAPRVEGAESRTAELRLLPPSSQRPLGGAGVRLWARISNPNPLGLTLSTLAGDLYLEGSRAAEVNLPLGLPLPAQGDTVVPLDISIGFSDLPELAQLAQRWLAGSSVGYTLEGTLGVDAGALGQPTFGPMRLLSGSLDVRR